MPLLDLVKNALRLTVGNYDAELLLLIQAAKLDLGIAGVVLPQELDEICQVAIITYCKLHFIRGDSIEYDQLKRAYDEQKAQLTTATGYTDWGSAD